MEPDHTQGRPAFAGLRRPRPNTPGFEDWFAGSVVVEPDGRPLVAYHGTTVGTDFESFSESDFFGSGTFGKGINLTSSPVDASKYASTDLTINHDLGPKAEVHAYKLTGQNGGPEFSQAYRQERDRLTTNGAGRVIPVFVSMRNPLRISREKLVVSKGAFLLAAAEADIGRDVAEALYERFDRAPDGSAQFRLVEARRATKIYRQIASIKNCDGLVIEPEFAPKGSGARHYLVFSAQQVKSAIGNSGRFDPASPSLTDSQHAAPANEMSEEGVNQSNVPKAVTVEEPQKQLSEPACPATIPSPRLRIDNPGGRWLADKRRYIDEDGVNRFGTPASFGPVTGVYDRAVMLPVSLLRTIPGLRNEQDVVRERDLRSLVGLGLVSGRFPLSDSPGDGTYNPFIQVDKDGKPWMNEGNHRVMTAVVLGWEYVPVHLSYFVGGEACDGPLSPPRVLEYDAAARAAGYTPTTYGGRVDQQRKTADEIEQAVRATVSQAALLEFSDTMTSAFADVGRAAEIGRMIADVVEEVGRGRPRMELTDTNGNTVGRFTFLAAVPQERTAMAVQDGAIRLVIDLQGRVCEADRTACVRNLLQEAVKLIGDGVEPLDVVIGAENEAGVAKLSVNGFGLVAQAEAQLRASGFDMLENPTQYPWGWNSDERGLSKEFRVRDYDSDDEEVMRRAWFNLATVGSDECSLLITDAQDRALHDAYNDLETWMSVD